MDVVDNDSTADVIAGLGGWMTGVRKKLVMKGWGPADPTVPLLRRRDCSSLSSEEEELTFKVRPFVTSVEVQGTNVFVHSPGSARAYIRRSGVCRYTDEYMHADEVR